MKIKMFTNSGIFDRSVVLDGFTMNGYLTLARNPMTAKEAATKRYVDNFPYSLSVDNITGQPVLFERIGGGFSGDLTVYNASQTVLKPIGSAGSYTKVTVNAKGQIIAGVTQANDIITPTLAFSEIKNRPTLVDGYVSAPTNYIRDTASVNNTTFSGMLSLSRIPTAATEVASYGYLTSAIASGGRQAPGELAFKPNTVTHAGYLRANGSILAKADYTALYSAIGSAYNIADGIEYSGKPWKHQSIFNSDDTTPVTFNWSTVGNSLVTNISSANAIVTKNRAYILGGLTSNSVSAATNNIQVAQILEDGTLGNWASLATKLPTPTHYSQFLIIRNRLYMFGGHDGTNYSNKVFYTTIAADGALGTWSAGTSLPVAMFGHQMFVTNTHVYVLGGQDGSSSNLAVYRAAINSDGTLGAWGSGGTNLPASIICSQAMRVGNRVYTFGGQNLSGVTFATVFWSTIDANGLLGAWTESTPLLGITAHSQIFATKKHVYVIGGFTETTARTQVYQAKINTDYSLDAWTNNTSLPSPVGYSVGFIAKNRIYICGGANGASQLAIVRSSPFVGGLNDYMTPGLFNSTTHFKLPDLTSKSSNIYEYYIKAN